jgi:hypothetical protein
VRFAAGALTAAAACSELNSADACYVSPADWSAGRLLMIMAVRGGKIEVSHIVTGVHHYRFDTLNVPSRKLCLGSGDYEVVKQLLEEAKAAGVIETVEASLAAIASQNDLRVNMNELRSAGEQILSAIGQIFMRQKDVAQRLGDLENRFERYKRVQQWTQLANIVFSLIPFAGGSLACVVAGAAPAFEGMQISNVVESLLGVVTGNQAAVTAPLFNRFFSCGSDMLSEDGLAVMPTDASTLLERVASELGLSMEGLRKVLKETAQRMAEGGDSGGPPISVEVLVEDGDEVEGREGAGRSTGCLNGSAVGDLGARFEGATTREQSPDPVSSASENTSPPDTACDPALGIGTGVAGRKDEQDIYREAVAALLGAEACEAELRNFEGELQILKICGVTVDLVSTMSY